MSQNAKGVSTGTVSIKALLIIAGLTIAYQVYVDNFVDEEVMSFADFSYGLTSLAVGITAVFVVRRYWGSPVFGKTYLALALGFFALFVGDLIYNYYWIILEVEPYPSIADVFFIGFYAFAGYHLVKNVKYFKKDTLTWFSKIGVVAIAAAMTIGFGLFTLEYFYEDPEVYLWSMGYVGSSAVLLALAIIAATIFRNSVLGVAWFMLVIGIFLYAVADLWYYYLEEIGEFSILSPVNTLWVLSNMFMIYALIVHKKTI